MVWPIVTVAVLVAQSQSPRDWSQPHGNAQTTASCDVEPVRAPPTRAWRQAFDEILAGPVVAGEELFAVVREGKERKLVALRAATGEILGRKTLDKGSPQVEVVAERGLAIVVEPAQIQTFSRSGNLFRFEKKVDGPWTGEPLLIEGILVVQRDHGAKTAFIDAVSGKLLNEILIGSGRPSIELAGKSRYATLAIESFDAGGNLVFVSTDLQHQNGAIAGAGSRSWAAAPMPDLRGHETEAVLIACGHDIDAPAWYLWSPARAEARGLCRHDSVSPIRFDAAPAVWNQYLIGFDVERRLLRVDVPEKKIADLLPSGTMPKGAARGAASIARDVLYLGNWAVELGSGRVLWCDEGIEPDGPAIPAGDGLAVVRTKGHELVGLVDPNRAAAAPTAPTNGTRAPRPRLPSEDGALARELGGDEIQNYDACVAALRFDQLDALQSTFDQFTKFQLFDECERLLREMKETGLDSSQAEALAHKIAGRQNKKADNIEAQRAKLKKDERTARERVVARVLAAADWCAAHAMPFAATSLVKHAAKLLPDRPPELERVKPWIPATFPWRDQPAAAQLWIDWAAELLPSGARFLARDDAAWKRVVDSAFATDSVALRTANLLLFTREEAPNVIGACLRHGEAAVRALDELLGPSPVGAKTGDEPLEIRLHRSRAEYLADKIGGREPPMPWSAGVYSSADGVSRFYAQNDNDAGDPLARELHSILAHEITHHYIDRRWIPGGGRSSKLPGFWMVEGFAEFVSEQAVEMSRRGAALDDVTVSSLDVCAAMSAKQKLLPLDFQLAMTQQSFGPELEGGGRDVLALRHHLKRPIVDRRSLFYSQSAALTFFALHRCGEAGRKGYFAMIAGYYRGVCAPDPWKQLGFSDAASLQSAFNSFIAGL